MVEAQYTNRNIYLLYAMSALVGAAFVIATLIPYYRDAMGLTFHDFLIGEAVFAAVVVFLEVPSGWISDVWHRKYTLAAGAFFWAAGYACLFGDNLAWAISGQAIIGIGVSLISGTNTAMLYDTLLSAGRTDEFRAREGMRASLGFYAIACASAVSGLLYTVDHRLPLALTILTLIGAMIAALWMKEPERHKKRPEKHPLADMIDTARYALHGHADIGMIILFAAVMFCATKLIMWSQQPYYMEMKLPEVWFGVLMSAGFGMAALSSHFGHLLDGRISGVRALAVVWAIAFAVCVGASLHLGWSGVILMMIGGTCLYGVGNPRVSEEINKRVSSERRATILSTQSLLVSLFFIPVSMIVGHIADTKGVTYGLQAIAGWLCLAGMMLALLVARKRKKS